MKEIYKAEEVKEKILSGVNKLADTVLLTMGPNGKTVIITDNMGRPYITKDGVSVANNITFKDPIEDTAATLLKEVAQRTVEQAGDGTTTSICLAQAFINKGYELLDEGISYNEIKESLDILEKDVLQQLQESSKKCTSKDIINVATISANNDSVIGEIINKAYSHSNIVKVEESDNEQDELVTVNGIQLDTPYFTKAFINNPKKGAIEYNKCKLVIYDGKVDNIKDLEPALKGQQDLPIVIIADHFHDTVVSILKSNYNNGNLEIGLIKSPSFAESRRNIMKDIIAYTSAHYPNPSKDTDLYISTIDSIFSDKDKTIISKKEVDIESYLITLKFLLENEKDKNSKKLISNRINTLEGNLAVIKVGGKSELEMKERKDRIDDAVLAVKSALEEGVVKGGGVALIELISKLDINYFMKTLAEPFINIYPNEKMLTFELQDTKILDPLKVTRCALQNAISVAKTILSTEAIVLNDRLWN